MIGVIARIANFEGILGFSVPSIILVKAGFMQITMQRARLAWLRMTLDCSRIAKENRDGEWIFCRGKEADVASFLQVAKIRNIRKICEADLISRLFPETGRSQSNEPWNTKQTKTDRNPPIKNHKPWPFELVQVNMCFLRGPLRWLTEQKNPKFLRSLQNAQGDTTNFAITWPVRTRCNFIVWYSFTLLYSSKRFTEKGSSPWY